MTTKIMLVTTMTTNIAPMTMMTTNVAPVTTKFGVWFLPAAGNSCPRFSL
jgi:hypothetical protein